MTKWIPIPQNDCDKIWGKFYKDFFFKPSIYTSDWPSIKTDKPNIKIDIAYLWDNTYDESNWISIINKGINSFISISNLEEEIIVLDWQHQCFYVNPKNIKGDTMLPDENTSIMFPSFIPDGEYYIFITKDFENIWFGHPWEKTITIIGDKLIKAYNFSDM